MYKHLSSCEAIMPTYPTKTNLQAPRHTNASIMTRGSSDINISIDTWPEEAVEALRRAELSSTPNVVYPSGDRSIRGTGVTFEIPLDIETSREERRRDAAEHLKDAEDEAATHVSAYAKRREPPRRDSLKRREALLKGKEGSRRRQKWENGASSRSVGTSLSYCCMTGGVAG